MSTILCTYFVSELSITYESTITTATVTFHPKNPKNIVRYEAFVDKLTGRKCSVPANTKPLQCTLRGIPEAVNFNILARACRSGSLGCERPVEMEARTKLRRQYSFYILSYNITALPTILLILLYL